MLDITLAVCIVLIGFMGMGVYGKKSQEHKDYSLKDELDKLWGRLERGSTSKPDQKQLEVAASRLSNSYRQRRSRLTERMDTARDKVDSLRKEFMERKEAGKPTTGVDESLGNVLKELRDLEQQSRENNRLLAKSERQQVRLRKHK